MHYWPQTAVLSTAGKTNEIRMPYTQMALRAILQGIGSLLHGYCRKKMFTDLCNCTRGTTSLSWKNRRMFKARKWPLWGKGNLVIELASLPSFWEKRWLEEGRVERGTRSRTYHHGGPWTRLTINETLLSQNAQNTFISQCPNHYHLEYAFILNFDLNKKNIKKHISSWIFLLRESYGGKENV